MAKVEEIFGNFIFLGLFIFAGIAFVVITQSNNEATQPIANDPVLNNSYSDLEESLSSLESVSQTQYSQFTEEAPQPGFTSIVLFGIVSAGKTFSNVILSTFSILIKLPIHVLGLPDELFSVVASWLVIVLIVAAWILYKVGG